MTARPRAVRVARRAASRAGQVMVLFALVVPVLTAFAALAITASLSLTTKAHLDEAALTAAIGASGDACISSPYGFDLYKCQSAAATPIYAAHPGPLPGPPFTPIVPGQLYPTNTNCTDPTSGSTYSCVITEQQAAYASATATATAILAGDYPNRTITTCQGNNGLVPGWSASACGGLATTSNVVVQADVSYWYYFDDYTPGNDIPATVGPTTDLPSDDATSLAGATGGQYLSPPDDGDTFPLAEATTKAVCPAASKPEFSRRVVVTVWLMVSQPLGAFLNQRTTLLHATSTSYGCGQ